MVNIASSISPIKSVTHPHPARSTFALKPFLEYIKELVTRGGPEPSEYSRLTHLIEGLIQYLHSESLNSKQFESIRQVFGDAQSPQTIQGMAFHKPHGYAGDYEIIEKIYKYHVSPNPMLSNWDRYFHSHSAPQAVRNRVSYFLEQIWKLKSELPDEVSILNVASGPGRDMYESLQVIGKANVFFDCVDQDLNAIQYAQSLCRDFLSNITFTQRNVFRFIPTKPYHLIWSAGLFDYFTDSLFKRVLKRLLPFLRKKGKLVIGNFSETNPNRGYMELFDWKLYHRSKEKLRSLAEECGVHPDNISIEQEPEGVNLFLHIVNAQE